MIVFGNQDDARAISDMAKVAFDPQRDKVIASIRDGILMGGVIYTGFASASCYVHFAGLRRNWICRDLLWVSFDYPFKQLSFDRIYGVVPESNHRSIRLVVHLGFFEVTRIPRRYRDGGGDIVYAIDYERAKQWLQIKPRMFKTGVS